MNDKPDTLWDRDELDDKATIVEEEEEKEGPVDKGEREGDREGEAESSSVLLSRSILSVEEDEREEEGVPAGAEPAAEEEGKEGFFSFLAVEGLLVAVIAASYAARIVSRYSFNLYTFCILLYQKQTYTRSQKE